MGTKPQKIGLALVLIAVAVYLYFQIDAAGGVQPFLDNVKKGEFFHKTTTTGMQATPTPRTTVVATKVATPTPKKTSTPTPRPTAVLLTTQATVLAAINTQRDKAGVPVLTVNAQLQSAAQAHAADMAKRNYFSHDTPEGVTFQERVAAAGYTSGIIAENIGVTGSDLLSVVNTLWMQSSGHKANMLNTSYAAGGIGVSSGTYNGQPALYVVALFGAVK